MNRKEHKPKIRPATVGAAGLLLMVAGGSMLVWAGFAYADNYRTAHWLDESLQAARFEIGCREAGP